ncbi:hypothetical protein D3C86_1534160 [compost metagenome]
MVTLSVSSRRASALELMRRPCRSSLPSPLNCSLVMVFWMLAPTMSPFLSRVTAMVRLSLPPTPVAKFPTLPEASAWPLTVRYRVVVSLRKSLLAPTFTSPPMAALRLATLIWEAAMASSTTMPLMPSGPAASSGASALLWTPSETPASIEALAYTPPSPRISVRRLAKAEMSCDRSGALEAASAMPIPGMEASSVLLEADFMRPVRASMSLVSFGSNRNLSSTWPDTPACASAPAFMSAPPM